MFDPVPRDAVFSHVAAMQTTPPADSPASFLAWALGVSLGVIVILWGLREKTNRDALTRAIADKDAAEQRAKNAEAKHDTEMATATARHDAREHELERQVGWWQRKWSEEVHKTTRTVLAIKAQRSATPQPFRTPHKRIPREEPEDDDYELSTGVTEAINDYERERIETEAVESTPPGYRRPLPSKPR